jgi:hypothetical protein
MKIFVFIAMFLLGFAANGQVLTNNFFIENGDLNWQKVYSTNLSLSELSTQLKTSGIFEKMEVDSLFISGELRQFDVDYKGAGYSMFTVPSYVGNTRVSGFALIELKDGRYRVTLSKILLIDAVNAGGVFKIGQERYLNDFALVNGKPRDYFKKAPSVIYDYTFNKLLELKEKKKDDW